MTEKIGHAMKLARDCAHKLATPANWFALEEALKAIEAEARADERERISEWIERQRNTVPATGAEFAASIRALT